jgi:hypothetical protein
VEDTIPVQLLSNKGTGSRKKDVPIDPISIGLLIPRNILTPIPSSEHSSAMSLHV